MSQFHCLFCNTPGHLIHDCPIAERYFYEGKISKNKLGRYTLPDGRYPSHKIPGRNLRERVDNHLAAERTPVSQDHETLTAHFLEAVEVPDEPGTLFTDKVPLEFIECLNVLTFDLSDTSNGDMDEIFELWDLQDKIYDICKARAQVLQKAKEARLERTATASMVSSQFTQTR